MIFIHSSWRLPKDFQILFLPFALIIFFTKETASLPTQDTKFDFFTFSMRWAPTACEEWKESGKTHTCRQLNAPNSWIVHGLWPSVADPAKDDPQFCNKTVPFDANVLQPILSQLEQQWPDMYRNDNEDTFWKHEWLKHGTCALQVPDIVNNELDYFNRGLNLAQMQLPKKLSDSGINPGSNASYKLIDIQAALKKSFGFDTIVRCYYEKNQSKFLIDEIRLCFDKNLTMIACGSEAKQRDSLQQNSTCSKHKNVFYLDWSEQKIETDNIQTDDLSAFGPYYLVSLMLLGVVFLIFSMFLYGQRKRNQYLLLTN